MTKADFERKRKTSSAYFETEIKKITAAIVKKYNPEKIILFGSLARSQPKPDSDIDLFIIKNTKEKFHHRIGDVLNIVDYDSPLEPLVYTPQELKKRISLGDFFIEEVLTTGKVIYDKTQ